MKELNTILGTEIPLSTRGIIYLCNFDHIKKTLTVVNDILYDNAFHALNAYANIPNPESQLVQGTSYDDLIKNLHKLHDRINDTEWVKQLEDYL